MKTIYGTLSGFKIDPASVSLARQLRRAFPDLRSLLRMWRLQPAQRQILFHLVLDCPSLDFFEVATCMLCVEIDERPQSLRFAVYPNRAKDANIDIAHETLTQKVEAVRDMPPLYIFWIPESFLAPIMVIVVTVEQ
jgi:hypothetical protein